MDQHKTRRWRFAVPILASAVASWLAISVGVITAQAAVDPYNTGPYLNPLRYKTTLTPARIDQGVDYFASGEIDAMGDGTIDQVLNSGWPHGVFIAYHFTDGPFSGLEVYAAECITPAPGLAVGSSVNAYTRIGTMISCKDDHYGCNPCGIETGWGDRANIGQAMGKSQWNGTNSTAYGVNFNQLLVTLGAPGGKLVSPVVGSTSGTWPVSSRGSLCSAKSGTFSQRLTYLSRTRPIYAQGTTFVGDENLYMSLERITAPDHTWCFQGRAVLSWASGATPDPTGSFNLDVRVSCNHAYKAVHWAFEQSYTSPNGYVNSGWLSSACSIAWGVNNAGGSYGAQVEDQYGYKNNFGIPASHYTYLTYGTF
jgi:hypothetical protein